jgi:hypothetical protein
MMKKLKVLAALPLCFAVSCNVFFSNNTGEEGAVTLSLEEGGIYTGGSDGFTGSGDSAVYGGMVPAGEGGQPASPDLGDPRIVIYDASGKALRSYTLAGNQSSWDFSLPAGGPYQVDFSAPVQHPANPQDDKFPFVTSFGATARLDSVAAGSSQDLVLPLRVRETAIMAPYMREKNSGVFAPFYDLPPEYPEGEVLFINRGDVDELCLDFDPYGRLFTTVDDSKNLYRIENWIKKERIKSTLFSGNFLNVAFNFQNGALYRSNSSGLGNVYTVTGIPSGSFVTDLIDAVKNVVFPDDLTLPIFTVDETGAFYTISDAKIYRTASDGQSTSCNIADIIDPAGQDWAETPDNRQIIDLKALNGYLYVVLVVHFGADTTKRYYDYVAAVPLESIKNGAGEAAWFAGGKSVDELDEKLDRYSLKGFFGPVKIVGWGPERIYVYDHHDAGDAGFRRIVEVNLRDHTISRAGLVVPQ